MSPKTQERLLFLISPIGLIALWQVLLMAGIGDRRFVPAPSDIAWRYWEMLASGELAKHALVTLWRVFAGFFLGSIPGIDFHYFNGSDVVRHPLVRKIIEAYEHYKNPMGNGSTPS